MIAASRTSEKPRDRRQCAPERASDGHHRAWRHAVHDAGGRRVPRDGGGEDPEPAADVQPVVAVPVRDPEEPDREHDLGDLQGEEDAQDGEVDARRPHQHVRVEDRERDQEPRERVVDVRALQQPGKAGRARQEHDERAEGEPKASIRRERGRAEDVSVGELPHAGAELDEAAVEQRRPEPDAVGDERRVVPAEQERRERERGETKRRGVGRAERPSSRVGRGHGATSLSTGSCVEREYIVSRPDRAAIESSPLSRRRAS